MTKRRDTLAEYEAALTKVAPARLVLRLYVAGSTPHSRRAIANLKEICAHYLEGDYDLKVIDIYQQPALAKEEQIIAVPTLVREAPLPVRRLIGDLADTEHVLVGLDLKKRSRGHAKDSRRKESSAG